MTIILGVVESVPDQESRRRPKSDEAELRTNLDGQLLVEKRADREAPRPTGAEQRHQAVQGLPRINNILDEQDMFSLQLGLGIVQEPDGPARDLAFAVGAGDQEIDLDRALDRPDQIAQEDEASLEKAEDEQLAVRIRVGDLGAELGDPRGDGRLS